MTTTPTDWRALCIDLADSAREGHVYGIEDALAAIDAALAQPEPQSENCPGCEGTPAANNSPCAVCGRLAQTEPQGPTLEPRGCPIPGACSCPTMPTVPPELIRALELAEAALADIGDAEREPGDDLAWAEARAAQDLPRIRAARRPKPPNLTKQALIHFESFAATFETSGGDSDLIRRALEQLTDDITP